MRKEKLKTVVLTALVASSFILTNYAWSVKKLWSNDYNFFTAYDTQRSITESIMSKLPWFKQSSEHISVKDTTLWYPQKLVVKYDSGRAVYFKSNSIYKKYWKEILGAFTKVLESNQDVKSYAVDENEWLTALKSRSFMVDFGNIIDTKMLGEFFGIKNTNISQQVQSCKEVVIIPGDKITSNVIFYIKDYANNKIIKYYIDYDYKYFIELMNKYKALSFTRYKFSFEQGFDKEKIVNEDTEQLNKVILDSKVLFPIDKQNLPTILGIKPENVGTNQHISEILKQFKYSENTIRKYTRTDNTLVFVENDSMLQINPEGLIVYEADDDAGLKITSSDSQKQEEWNFYKSMDAVTDFMDKIWPISEDMYISSIVLNNPDKTGSYTFTFDYMIEGVPVTIDLDDKNYKIRHGAEVQIDNGVIKTYKQYIRDYKATSFIEIESPIPFVLDETYKKVNKDIVKIKNMFLDYKETGNGKSVKPRWNVNIGK